MISRGMYLVGNIACDGYGGEERCTQDFGEETLGKETNRKKQP